MDLQAFRAPNFLARVQNLRVALEGSFDGFAQGIGARAEGVRLFIKGFCSVFGGSEGDGCESAATDHEDGGPAQRMKDFFHRTMGI